MDLCCISRARLLPSAALRKTVSLGVQYPGLVLSREGSSLFLLGAPSSHHVHKASHTVSLKHVPSFENQWFSRRRDNRRLSVRCTASEASDGSDATAQPPQEVVLKAISEVSKMEGRHAKTTNVVIGGTESPYSGDWMELDKKVNTYPSLRGFTAIGSGGNDFVKAMVVAVESVLQEPVPEGNVRQRESAQGRYVSVKIGPLRVESSAQVREIYQAMRRDIRMRYFL